MIIIDTTPNLYGVSVKGDYNDLNELYDSLSRYLGFYCENEEDFPYSAYEYLLSLNYDIRHAYMGAREIDIQDNNAEEYGNLARTMYEISKETGEYYEEIHEHHQYGNLYFSVNILYPLIFHYINAFEYILNAWYKKEWFSKSDFPYDEMMAEKDRAVIAHFTALMWENLGKLFGKEMCLKMYRYVKESYEFVLTPALYTDAMLHYQISQFPRMSEEEKKNTLTWIFYQQLDAEFRRKNEAIQEARLQFKAVDDAMKSSKINKPLKQGKFFDRLMLISSSNGVPHDEFEELLQDLWPISDPDADPIW